MVSHTRTNYDGSTITYTEIETGRTDFGFVDQKGRACGYAWEIEQIVHSEPRLWGRPGKDIQSAAGEPVIQLISNPTRNGKGYGPAFNRAIVRTLEEARQLAVKRADQACKRDHKKFVMSQIKERA
jgi:hypothetical protein